MSDVEFEELPFDLGPFQGLGEVHALWCSWCAGSRAPRWRDVDLAAIPPRLLPTTLVVDVLDGGDDFVYRFWGTGMTSLYGADETANRVSQLPASFKRATSAQLRAVLEAGAPRLFRAVLRRSTGAVAEKINLPLPVTDDDGRIDKVITVSEVGSTHLRLGDDLADIFRGRHEV